MNLDHVAAMPLWLHALVIVAAVARITILLIDDVILDAPRDWVLERVTPGGHLEYLATCPYCLGIWISAAVAGAWVAWPVGTTAVMLPLAVAMLAVLVVHYDERASDHDDPPPVPPA